MQRFFTKITQARFISFGWTGEQMTQAGNGLIQNALIPRVRRGLTVYDAPAPPLKPKYARQKLRRGLEPIRNWMFTGRTLRSMKVLTAKTNQAVIGFTDPVTNLRAFINNRRARQFGVSPSDERVLEGEFGKLPPPVRAAQVK